MTVVVEHGIRFRRRDGDAVIGPYPEEVARKLIEACVDDESEIGVIVELVRRTRTTTEWVAVTAGGSDE